MRIIAGRAKGRKLSAPKEGTRPMTGRARESIFSILDKRLSGARVLDLFAGTGSLGLEALSRGASTAVLVDNGREAGVALHANVESVGLGGTVRSQDVASFLRSCKDRFNVIFVDPPYAMEDSQANELLKLIGGVLDSGGVLVVHRQARSITVEPEFLRTIDERRYGDAVVTMMERADSD